MGKHSVSHGSFVIERQYAALPDRVFAAFSDSTLKRRWFAEGNGRNVDHYELDFRVGGRESSQSRLGENSPFPGARLANETVFLDIVPDARIVSAYTMSMEGRRFSASLATIELLPCDGGTRLTFTEYGAYFEGSDGPKIREAGWAGLLDLLGAELAR